MRRHFLRSLSLLAVGCAVLALATPGVAQWGWGYSNRAQVGRLIRQAENRSNVFVAMVDRNSGDRFDREDRFDRYGRRDQIEFAGRRLNESARDLEQQLDAVSQAFDSGNSYRVRSDLDNALNTARRINITMQRRDLNVGVERQWSMLRFDLNRLARVYNLQQIG